MLETLALLFPAPTCSQHLPAFLQLPQQYKSCLLQEESTTACLSLHNPVCSCLTELFSAMVFLSTLVIPHM